MTAHTTAMNATQVATRAGRREWIGLLRDRLSIAPDRLPILCDADFMLGESRGPADDRYVLCEINVSSVAPYPDSATPVIVAAMQSMLLDRR